MQCTCLRDGLQAVALHPEGVDRNTQLEIYEAEENMSPSTRRAWIEIPLPQHSEIIMVLTSPSTRRAWIEICAGRRKSVARGVALHPEGVDRNSTP